MNRIKIVIMAGGIGSRFWPKSRTSIPKQFLNLQGKNTMIQDTVNRVLPIACLEDIYIVTNEAYLDLVKDQLPELPEKNILLEPYGRNTAACIGLAAIHIKKDDENAIMIVLPADHVIRDDFNFRTILKNGANLADKSDKILTIGIVPTHPEEGYGYIKLPSEITTSEATKIERFVEKPDRITAEAYLASKHYLWNSGMFIWSIKTILKNFETYLPEHYKKLLKIESSINSDKYTETLEKEYERFEKISIDYGILEQAKEIYVIPSDFGWDDVGSWNSLERLNKLDANENYIKGNVLTIGTNNSIIEGSNRLLCLVGVSNLVVVDTDDAILIVDKNHTNKIRDLVNTLKTSKEDYI